MHSQSRGSHPGSPAPVTLNGMCGRYASARRDIDLIGDLDIDETDGVEPALSWNLAPTQDARVVVERPCNDNSTDPPRTRRQLRTLRWGLVPSWAEHPKVGAAMINARVETVVDKPAFRWAVARRRCLVPADGYYEWLRTPDGGRRPHYLTASGPLTFAGLYEFWRDPRRSHDEPERWLASFTILTGPAAAHISYIHDRAPVVIPDGLHADWLDPHLTDTAEVMRLLDAAPAPDFSAVEVRTSVNNYRNNGPHLIEPIDSAALSI